MPGTRLYVTRTEKIERALEVAAKARPELGRKAGAAKRLEALIDYALDHWESENARNERLLAYQELAAVPGRRERIKRNTRARAKQGLL